MDHFTIESYEIDIDGYINVTTEKYGCHIPVYIPVDKFEQWLTDKGKLEWVNDESQSGEHKQASGNYSLSEYWDLHPVIIKFDIYTYITTNPITFREITVTDSVQSLLTQFELAHIKKS